MKRTGSTNQHLQELIIRLKKTADEKSAPIWSRIAKDLERPTRIQRAVNLSRINRYTDEGELVIVPGKILGSGELDHKITLASWRISHQALEKVLAAKGDYVSIDELLAKNPVGKNIKIIG